MPFPNTFVPWHMHRFCRRLSWHIRNVMLRHCVDCFGRSHQGLRRGCGPSAESPGPGNQYLGLLPRVSCIPPPLRSPLSPDCHRGIAMMSSITLSFKSGESPQGMWPLCRDSQAGDQRAGRLPVPPFASVIAPAALPHWYNDDDININTFSRVL
jgi:hypothetical protein